MGRAGDCRPSPPPIVSPSCGGEVSLHLLRRYLRELEGVSTSPSRAPPEALEPRPEYLDPFFPAKPTSLPPRRKEILQRGQCTGTLGDIFTWFHLVNHMHSVTTVSVYLVFCSPTAKQPGHLASKDFMPFPSS